MKGIEIRATEDAEDRALIAGPWREARSVSWWGEARSVSWWGEARPVSWWGEARPVSWWGEARPVSPQTEVWG
jgi:hypothetical protein